MDKEKLFTYEALTETAGKRITEFMEKSRKATDDFSRWSYRSWAYGVFTYWSEVTSGWKKEGDTERLEALTE